MSFDILFKQILDFIIECKWLISIILICFLFKNQIRNIIDRCTGIKINGVGASIEVEAKITEEKTSPIVDKIISEGKSEDTERIDRKIEISQENKSWIEEFNEKIANKDLDGAKESFLRRRRKNEEISAIDTGIYYYKLYQSGLDNKALQELKDKIDTATTEEDKLDLSIWYEFCFTLTNNHKKTIEHYNKLLSIVKKEISKTRIIVRIAAQLINDNEAEKAKTLIADRINSVKSDEEFYSLYSLLSEIEKKLGNLKQSAYCLDKSLDYSPMDKEVMFSSALEAEKEKIHYIEISNYSSLVSIDEKNDSTLNNLAVSLSNQKLNSLAVDFYIKSAKLENSLALTNLGFIYLQAGLTDKAKDLAEDAIAIEPPHPNAYILLTDINNTIERENKKWEELKTNSLILQKESRFYTQAYYEKTLINFKSIGTDWLVNGVEASIVIDGDKIKIEWTDKTILPIKRISGSITNNSFSGQYSAKSETKNNPSLLGLSSNKNIDGIGYYNLNDDSIIFFSENIDDIFKLKFTRKQI